MRGFVVVFALCLSYCCVRPAFGRKFGRKEGNNVLLGQRRASGKSELFTLLQDVYSPLQKSHKNCACSRTMQMTVVKPQEDGGGKQQGGGNKMWKHTNLLASGKFGFAATINLFGMEMARALRGRRALIVPHGWPWIYAKAMGCKGETLDCFFSSLGTCHEPKFADCPKQEQLEQTWLKKYRYASGTSPSRSLTNMMTLVRGPLLHVTPVYDFMRRPHDETLLGLAKIMAKLAKRAGITDDHDPGQPLDELATPDPLVKFKHKGELWYHSQILGFLFQLRPALQSRVEAMPPFRKLRNKPYIAFHVRSTDNLKTLTDEWDIPAAKVYKLERFMAIAKQLKKRELKKNGREIHIIYVATDNDAILRQIAQFQKKGTYPGWKFVVNTKARRAGGSVSEQEWATGGTNLKKWQQNRWEWMFKGKVDSMSVLLDLTLFQRADYIVGSQTSNVFRLATALNFFHHDADQKRAYEIDHTAWQPGHVVDIDP